MKVIYNGVDITNQVSINYCVHEMFAEKQADGLTIRFNDPNGNWVNWQPETGHTIRITDGAADTGKMYVHRILPQNGMITIRAVSTPPHINTKKTRSWEGVRLIAIANDIAKAHDLGLKLFGVEDRTYAYLRQDNQSDLGFLSSLCSLESCQMLIYDGCIVIYSEPYMESKEAVEVLKVGNDGIYRYGSAGDTVYRSCEVRSGAVFGKFEDPNAEGESVLRVANVRATSNGEAARFAKGLLREANKYAIVGRISKELQRELSPATVVSIKTEKAASWNGNYYIYRIRNDYVNNQSVIYFRGMLEGY